MTNATDITAEELSAYWDEHVNLHLNDDGTPKSRAMRETGSDIIGWTPNGDGTFTAVRDVEGEKQVLGWALDRNGELHPVYA